jgi:hypothetical protein
MWAGLGFKKAQLEVRVTFSLPSGHFLDKTIPQPVRLH